MELAIQLKQFAISCTLQQFLPAFDDRIDHREVSLRCLLSNSSHGSDFQRDADRVNIAYVLRRQGGHNGAATAQLRE